MADRYDDTYSDDYDEDTADGSQLGDEYPDDDSPAGYSTGENDLEISRELDEDGNEVWFAKDSQIPKSDSIGHSLEEAMNGVEERREAYRKMLRRTRKDPRGKKD